VLPGLELPLFDAGHRALLAAAEAFVETHPAGHPARGAAVDAACRAHVRALGEAGFLRYCVPGTDGGATPTIESRALCILRAAFARHDALLDFAFAMQGLGSGAIALDGTPAQRARFLPAVATGRAIAAFALSEPEAGSDVAAVSTTARADGDDYVLEGEKTWISNGGIADFYTVFARTGEGAGARGLSAFVVPAETPGLMVAERIEVMAPHPLATLRFDGCRIPAALRLGAPGAGFKLAMRTLDVFRTSVAAAALGMGLRALDEARAHAARRRMFGQRLADFQLTQAKLADMALPLDAAALLTWRAAWVRDVQGARGTTEAAMAKLAATEWASDAIDAAVQLFGGRGVRVGETVEALYREIRALRIYEGASEVQKLIIGRALTDVAVAPPVRKEDAR
jgi:acyl-CoA dehydrogenase